MRSGLAVLPRGLGWRDIAGAGALAGIGFTVSLFVTELSFGDRALHDAARVSILVASVVASALGALILRVRPRPLRR